MKLRTRIILTLMPTLLPIIGFGMMEYVTQSEQLHKQIEQAASGSAMTARKQLNAFMRVKYEEFELLTQRLSSCSSFAPPSQNLPQVANALSLAPGYSALVISDVLGNVKQTLFSTHAHNDHILPRMLTEMPVLNADQRKGLLDEYRRWHMSLPALNLEVEKLEAETQAMVERGERLSHAYRTLQKKLVLSLRELSRPPAHIMFSGAQQVSRIGLPFTGDTFLLSTVIPSCSQRQPPELISVFMDRSQLEDVLYQARLDLRAQGYSNMDVLLADRNGKSLFSEPRHFSLSRARQSADEGAFCALEPIIDDNVLRSMVNDGQQTDDFWKDDAYDSAVSSFSRMSVMVYIAESEFKQRLDRLLINTSLWTLAGVTLLLLLIFRVSRHIVRPVQALKQHMTAVSEGELGLQLRLSNQDEFARLAETFNQMSSNLAEKERSLIELASTDPLTGLLNRRAFSEQAEVYGNSGQTRAMIILDLDHFKQINDEWGHTTGDLVLKQFAVILKESVREHDLAGRIGGEEFLLLINSVSPRQAREIAQRICEATARHQFVTELGNRFHITVSVGIADWHGGLSLTEVMSSADHALYDAKKGGRNRVCDADAVISS